MAVRRAASRTPATEPERSSDYWNVRFRKVEGQKWRTGHLIKLDGLIAEVVDQFSGNIRVLGLTLWDVEYRCHGPRGGIAWLDIVLAKEEINAAS